MPQSHFGEIIAAARQTSDFRRFGQSRATDGVDADGTVGRFSGLVPVFQQNHGSRAAELAELLGQILAKFGGVGRAAQDVADNAQRYRRQCRFQPVRLHTHREPPSGPVVAPPH